MSYDFALLALSVPARAKFPIGLYDLTTDPFALFQHIMDEEAFVERISAYPNMEHYGEHWIHRPDAPSFSVYCIRALPRGFLERWNPFVVGPEESAARAKAYPLNGVHLDMSGSWGEALNFYCYLRECLPDLVIMDKQTDLIYDESSFREFMRESNAR
jgi:hypothetical protein